ncbi:MAG: LysR family transcriptional regulator [Candidatus Lokiarchaeota archaeon]
MNIEYLRNFVKLAEYKSFSELSKDLSISQSTLSHRIAQIEHEFGDIVLINRTTKSFELTELGNICLHYARKIIELYDECEREIGRISDQNIEDIVISSSKLPGSQILPKYFAEFKNLYPQINFEILINNSRSSIDLVKKGFADFGGIGSFMGYKKKEFNYFVIGTDELYFVCSPNHELLKKGINEVSIKRLKNIPFILREEGSGTRNIFEKEFPEYESLNLNLELNDNDSIITTVSESNFISVLSKEIAEKAHESGLIEVLNVKEYPVIAKRDLYFIKLKDKKLSEMKQKFWEFLQVNSNKKDKNG